MTPRFDIDRERLVKVFFFTAFAFLLYQLFLLSKPFLASFLVSAMLAMTFFPLYKRLHARVKNANVAALVMTICVVIAAVAPLVGFIWLVIKESSNLLPAIQSVMAEINNTDGAVLREKLPPFIYERFESLAGFFQGINIDIKSIVFENAREVGAQLSAIGALVARNAIFTFFKLIILIISLFFMFRDGERVLEWGLGLVPMAPKDKQSIAKSAYETFKAVTTGVFLTAAAQGFTAMVGFLIVGVKMPLLLGLATATVSLLGASFIICIPVALFVMIESSSKGIFLLLWGAVLVGWLDNVLKPLLIGSRARMPFVLVFFSILGGIKMYGLLGLILGPVLLACVLAFVRIYRETYNS